ncbi:sensor domain-containing diguanylate cyclase [Acidocella sp.]|uniref:sensor domain-containing diguanylate cyclase n=1 Tax=Acidocella sp. TaxID=50710 RepID=UPI002628A1CC|nr:sensor domain-containing diguanylate cyclase [Acidocella sp.]
MLDRLTDEAGRLASLHRYEILDTAPEAPYDKITQLVRTVLDVPIATVSLIDADRQWFKSCLGTDVRETARDISFCTHTIQTREPMVINNAHLDERFAQNPLVLGPPFIASYAGAPLITPDGYALGSLCAVDTKPRIFEEWQVELLKSFAALVVDEFELRRRAHTDNLTGALSRGALLTEAERAISYFYRHNLPSALVAFDLDHFSQSNDTYGYTTSDAMLRACAGQINDHLREGDIFARLGGDEFALLLMGADVHQAMLTAERCRAALAGLSFDHDPALRVTASFGIAPLTPGYATAERWLAGANFALDEAKQTGRNKCHVQSGTPMELEDAAYISRRAAPPAEVPPPAALDDAAEDEVLARHRQTIEPLSHQGWLELQKLRRVQAMKSGRLGYGGTVPGITECRILNVVETGISVETNIRLTPVPAYFSVEFCGIYCRARTSRAAEFAIDLEFVFDGS